jgi:HAAS
MAERDAIEIYLDELVELLDGPGVEVRRMLAESEDHLREAETAGIDAGMTSQQAALAAIDRFGTPREVAERYKLMRVMATPGQVLAQVALSLALVGSFVLIGIGLSGALAAGGAAVLGPSFISGDAPGVTYTPDRCDDFMGFHPEADTCAEAAVLHHLDETVGTRADAGILGLLLLAGWLLARRAARKSAGPRVIPEVFVPLTATALFAAAAILLGGLGTVQWLSSGTGTGAGYFLTAGVVSLIATLGFGLWSLRRLQPGGPGASDFDGSTTGV